MNSIRSDAEASACGKFARNAASTKERCSRPSPASRPIRMACGSVSSHDADHSTIAKLRSSAAWLFGSFEASSSGSSALIDGLRSRSDDAASASGSKGDFLHRIEEQNEGAVPFSSVWLWTRSVVARRRGWRTCRSALLPRPTTRCATSETVRAGRTSAATTC